MWLCFMRWKDEEKIKVWRIFALLLMIIEHSTSVIHFINTISQYMSAVIQACSCWSPHHHHNLFEHFLIVRWLAFYKGFYKVKKLPTYPVHPASYSTHHTLTLEEEGKNNFWSELDIVSSMLCFDTQASPRLGKWPPTPQPYLFQFIFGGPRKFK